MANESTRSKSSSKELLRCLSLIQRGDNHVALEAAESSLDRMDAALIYRILCTHSDPIVRSAALELLQWCVDESDEFRITLLTHDADWFVRCDAVSALSYIRTEKAMLRIKHMACKDRSPLVRTWAINALLTQGLLQEPGLVLASLIGVERNYDPRIVLILWALRHGREDYLPLFRETAEAALQQDDHPRRQALARIVHFAADHHQDLSIAVASVVYDVLTRVDQKWLGPEERLVLDETLRLMANLQNVPPA